MRLNKAEWTVLILAVLMGLVLGQWLIYKLEPRRCTTDTDCMNKYGGDGSPRS